jgi:hypothetical protein
VEFAYGGWGTNQHLGTPLNLWDVSTHRAPAAGSSSVSGVAVAARLGALGDRHRHGRISAHPGRLERRTGLKATIGRRSARSASCLLERRWTRRGRSRAIWRMRHCCWRMMVATWEVTTMDPWGGVYATGWLQMRLVRVMA